MASNNDLDILAWTMLGEAGGEGPNGMADVGHVILNRLENGRYGSSISDVARANKQFSTWNAGEGGNNPQGRYPKSSAEFKKARALAEQVVAGAIPGPPGKPLDYHTPDISPYWADSKDKFGTYERNGHLFYASVPVPPGEIPNTVASALSVRPETRNVPLPAPRPTQRQPIASTTPSTGSSFASTAAPTYSVTPRLANDGGLYAYVDRGMEQPQFAGGFGSSTPNYGQRPAPRPATPVVPYSAGQTIATVATPQRAQLPAIPPPRSVVPRHFDVTEQRAAAAQDPRLAAALAAPQAPAAMRQPSASERAALAYVPPPAPVNTRIGQPPATRTVASVPVRPPAPGPMDDVGSMGSFADLQSRLGAPRVPGPSAPPKLGEERLVAGTWGVPAIKGLPTLPGQDIGVGTALSVMPPMPRPRPMQMQPQMASVPLPRPRPVQQQMAPISRGIFGMPTSSALRPTGRPPLNVVVQGANTQQPSGGSSSSSSPSSGFVHKGQQVYATPTKRYNTDTNSFETVTTYKPR